MLGFHLYLTFCATTMAELSALHAVCTLPPETSLGTHFYMKHGLLKSAKLWYMVFVHPFVCYSVVIFNYTMLVVFRRDCEKRLLASSCVCLAICPDGTAWFTLDRFS